MEYESGFAFWIDLCIQFGKEDAVHVANSYLECPVAPGDAKEEKFRSELRSAMKGDA